MVSVHDTELRAVIAGRRRDRDSDEGHPCVSPRPLSQLLSALLSHLSAEWRAEQAIGDSNESCRIMFYIRSLSLFTSYQSSYCVLPLERPHLLRRPWTNPTISSTPGPQRRQEDADNFKRVHRNPSHRFRQRQFLWQNGKRIRR